MYRLDELRPDTNDKTGMRPFISFSIRDIQKTWFIILFGKLKAPITAL
jgi:hypothetical protein